MRKKLTTVLLSAVVAGQALAADWQHINTRPNAYGVANYTYVDSTSINGTTLRVMEIIKGGIHHGEYVQYIVQTDCSDYTMRTVSNLQWYDSSGNYLRETRPGKPDWQSPKSSKDKAVWMYMCTE